jgi:hypothetical protein
MLKSVVQSGSFGAVFGMRWVYINALHTLRNCTVTGLHAIPQRIPNTARILLQARSGLLSKIRNLLFLG